MRSGSGSSYITSGYTNGGCSRDTTSGGYHSAMSGVCVM